MVIFSQWRPDGGYDYYQSDRFTAPFGNDLPDPALPAPTEVGVPSVEVGHPIPRGATHVGDGDLPVGIVAPMDRSRLNELLPFGLSPITWMCAGGLIVGCIWLWSSRGGKR